MKKNLETRQLRLMESDMDRKVEAHDKPEISEATFLASELQQPFRSGNLVVAWCSDPRSRQELLTVPSIPEVIGWARDCRHHPIKVFTNAA
jgi:hypothetical protein